MPGGEVEDSRVLEKAADDRADADRFAEAGDARPEAAEAANDEIDWNARARRLAQRCNDLRIFQLIHLGDDPGWPSGGAMLDFAADERHEALAHRGRSDQELTEGW